MLRLHFTLDCFESYFMKFLIETLFFPRYTQCHSNILKRLLVEKLQVVKNLHEIKIDCGTVLVEMLLNLQKIYSM